jgi:hypothetical protein
VQKKYTAHIHTILPMSCHYTHVCMYIRTYICICIFTCTHMRTRPHTLYCSSRTLHTYTFQFILEKLGLHSPTYTHEHTKFTKGLMLQPPPHTRMYMHHPHTHICTCTTTHTHVCTCTTHTHTYVHAHRWRKRPRQKA